MQKYLYLGNLQKFPESSSFTSNSLKISIANFIDRCESLKSVVDACRILACCNNFHGKKENSFSKANDGLQFTTARKE